MKLDHSRMKLAGPMRSKITIGGGPPAGRLGRLVYDMRVRTMEWYVDRELRKKSLRPDMSAEEIKRDFRGHELKNTESRIRNHYLLVTCCAFLILVSSVKAVDNVVKHDWKDVAFWTFMIGMWLWKGRSDFRTLRELRRHRLQLLVEDVHDL